MNAKILTHCLLFAFLSAALAAPPDFHRNIAPLLRQYCAGCHNDEDLKGELSLEFFADLQEEVNLRPGDPEKSQLIRLMTGKTEEPMPPADEPQPSAAEIAVFEAWIAAGAKGPQGEADVSILASLTVPKIAAKPGSGPITAIAQSKSGLQAIARFGSIQVGADLVIAELPGKVNALQFSPDGGQILAASGIAGLSGLAGLFDAKTGEKLAEFGDGYHRDVLYDAEFSPDGTKVATAGYDKRIAIWDRASGKRLRTIEIHNGAIFDLAFSPDSTVLASASADFTVKLWQVETGRRLDTLNQPQGEQFAVEFTPDGRFIVAGGADNRIRLWRFVSRTKPRINPLIRARYAHEGAVVKLAISGDGKSLISSGDDQAIKQWNLPKLTQIQALEDQPDVAAALILTNPETLTVARLDGSQARFSLKSGERAGSKPSTGPSLAGSIAENGSGSPRKQAEIEPNDVPSEAMSARSLPAEISGKIAAAGDVDCFWFHARAGETWVFEVEAARRKSKLDSKVEVLHAGGDPVERVKLQAVRDSWFTFRGKDSSTADDFRVHNWREMELNEYLYANGEVVKLWLYPRGPDSGFKVYPGTGKRHTYFGTTALAHALGEPAAIVEPIPAGAQPAPNGLPVYTIFYENDDDSSRHFGTDSRLSFTAPQTGDFVARVSDVRGFGGEDFGYTLKMRPRQPDFRVANDLKDPEVNPGSGKEFALKVDRFDDFDGEVRVEITGLPAGFSATNPLIVEAGQHMAAGVLFAEADAKAPAPEEAKRSKLVAVAKLGGREVRREIGTFGEIKLGKAPEFRIEIRHEGEALEIRPGETISAKVVAERGKFAARIEFGRDDSGRNFAHGLYVDNIGLNGLMLPEGVSERTFFITAAPWVKPSERLIHLRTNQGGKQAARPVLLRVLE